MELDARRAIAQGTKLARMAAAGTISWAMVAATPISRLTPG
jgi:hypothetical protein